MLEARDLSKSYNGGGVALDHLNLEVAPGEVFCLLGANGAGKTTTINLFLNFIAPTRPRRKRLRSSPSITPTTRTFSPRTSGSTRTIS